LEGFNFGKEKNHIGKKRGSSNAFTVHLPAYADSIGKDISIGAAIVSFCMVGLLLGKVTLVYLNDKTVIGTLIGVACVVLLGRIL